MTRQYLDAFALPKEAEAEMPEDDTAEPLPERIDLAAIATEALALALPDFPRARGAELGEATFAPPGAAPIDDTTPNPFAALSVLKTNDGG